MCSRQRPPSCVRRTGPVWLSPCRREVSQEELWATWKSISVLNELKTCMVVKYIVLTYEIRSTKYKVRSTKYEERSCTDVQERGTRTGNDEERQHHHHQRREDADDGVVVWVRVIIWDRLTTLREIQSVVCPRLGLGQLCQSCLCNQPLSTSTSAYS